MFTSNVQDKRGFTLIEVMIATAVSALILVGVYSMFSGVVTTRSGLENANNGIIFTESLERLVARDIRMITAGIPSLPPPQGNEERIMSFFTHDSLRFNKSLPVEVLYYIDTSLDNGTLYRRERQRDMNYQMDMPLVRNVSEWKVETFDGSEYRENFMVNRYIFKFTFKIDDKQIQFITGRMVEATNE